MVTRNQIFENVRDILRADMVTSVSLVSSFVDSVDKLPQVVLVSPNKDNKAYTFNGRLMLGSFDIDILTTSAKIQKTLLDEIEDIIFNNEDTLGLNKLKMTQSSPARLDVGKKQAHFVSLTFDFEDIQIG